MMLRLLAMMMIIINTYTHSINLAQYNVVTEYGTVTEKTVEGGSQYNDYYIVVLDSGDIHEVEADDLEVDDRVTVYFYEGEPLKTVYGARSACE